MPKISRTQKLTDFLTLLGERTRLESKIQTRASQLGDLIPGFKLVPVSQSLKSHLTSQTVDGRPRLKPGPKPGFKRTKKGMVYPKAGQKGKGRGVISKKGGTKGVGGKKSSTPEVSVS